MERGKIYEVETQRTNISAKQFFSHCRRTYEKKTGHVWLVDFEQWVDPLQPGRRSQCGDLRKRGIGMVYIMTIVILAIAWIIN